MFLDPYIYIQVHIILYTCIDVIIVSTGTRKGNIARQHLNLKLLNNVMYMYMFYMTLYVVHYAWILLFYYHQTSIR